MNSYLKYLCVLCALAQFSIASIECVEEDITEEVKEASLIQACDKCGDKKHKAVDTDQFFACDRCKKGK